MFGIYKRFLPLTRSYCTDFKELELPYFTVNFDSDKDIMDNYFQNVMLIGINLPENKNLLTEAAIENLTKSFQKFYNDDNVSCAILHGQGGNFCTGIESSEKAIEKSFQLIQTIHEGTKPTIAALSGGTLNFGLQLAVMCDLRVMDNQTFLGLGRKGTRTPISPFVLQKLKQVMPVSVALEIFLTNSVIQPKKADVLGLSNVTVPVGSCLSKALSWGLSIGLSSMKEISQIRSEILSSYSQS